MKKRLKSFLKEKNYTHIPLTYTSSNHFEIKAKINGVSGRFILDTGASNTCIDVNSQAQFGLKTKESEIKAAGAGALEMDTWVAKKNKVKIGEWKRSKMPLVVFDLVHVNQALVAHNSSPVQGIIGADILKKGKAIIDYDKKCLYLKLK